MSHMPRTRVINCPLNLPHCRLTCQSLSHASAKWHDLCPFMYWRKEHHYTAPLPPSATRTVHDDHRRLVCPFIWDDFKRKATIRLTTIRSYDQNFRKKISIQNLIWNYVYKLRQRISVHLWDFEQRRIVVCIDVSGQTTGPILKGEPIEGLHLGFTIKQTVY